MSKIKVGIVGCGSLATSALLPALAENGKSCEVTAFCDSNAGSANCAAAKFGSEASTVYTDYRDLIKDKNVDVVQIAVPNALHMPIAVAAFKEGKHVVCEKPMAESLESAEKMMEAWMRSGCMFTIGYQNRFRPEVAALKTACDNGELGSIYYSKAIAIRRRAVPSWGIFPNKAMQGGGPLIDIGTHALDLALWLTNNYEPASVTGSVFYQLGKMPEACEGNVFGAWDTENFGVEDSAFGFIKMKNGALISLESSWALNVAESREAAVTLCGTKAGAELRHGMSYPESELLLNRCFHGVMTEERISKTKIKQNVNLKAMEVRSWLSAIENGTNPAVRPEEAFAITRIIDAIYRSAESGAEVTLS